MAEYMTAQAVGGGMDGEGEKNKIFARRQDGEKRESGCARTGP